MKYTFLLKNLFIFFFLSVQFCVAQGSKEPYEYTGTLQISEKMIITYLINFTETEDGKIKGYSITDFLGKNRTKSSIEGVINHKKNTISFHEIENITTKSSADQSDFCYVHLKNAQIKQGENKNIIKGNFVGLYSNDSLCVNGYLYLVGTNDLLKKYNELVKKDSTLNDVIDLDDLKNKKYQNHLKEGDKLKTSWVSDTIHLEIWDAEKLDHDIITLRINGKDVLTNFEIGKSKKILTIPFTEKISTIEVIAVNEGDESPNTTNIILLDRELTTRIVSQLKTNEKVTLILEKK